MEEQDNQVQGAVEVPVQQDLIEVKISELDIEAQIIQRDIQGIIQKNVRDVETDQATHLIDNSNIDKFKETSDEVVSTTDRVIETRREKDYGSIAEVLVRESTESGTVIEEVMIPIPVAKVEETHELYAETDETEVLTDENDAGMAIEEMTLDDEKVLLDQLIMEPEFSLEQTEPIYQKESSITEFEFSLPLLDQIHSEVLVRLQETPLDLESHQQEFLRVINYHEVQEVTEARDIEDNTEVTTPSVSVLVQTGMLVETLKVISPERGIEADAIFRVLVEDVTAELLAGDVQLEDLNVDIDKKIEFAIRFLECVGLPASETTARKFLYTLYAEIEQLQQTSDSELNVVSTDTGTHELKPGFSNWLQGNNDEVPSNPLVTLGRAALHLSRRLFAA